MNVFCLTMIWRSMNVAGQIEKHGCVCVCVFAAVKVHMSVAVYSVMFCFVHRVLGC